MPGKRKIFVSEFDMKRLRKLVELLMENQSDDREKKHVELLHEALREAEVVEPEKIPGNVVTMNSIIQVRNLDTGLQTVYQLVFPGEADIRQNKVSVLAPIGASLIGCRVGGIVKLQVPAGLTTLKIEEIRYQPESAGDFHL